MLQPAVNIMVKAARAGGNVLLRHMHRLDALNVVEKQRMDYASEVDGLAEAEIIKELRRFHPAYAFLGEEGGAQGKHRYTWVIDPLDARLRDPRRGNRRERSRPPDLRHRSARRHQQLPARHAALVRIDRAGGERRTAARRDLRPAAQ
jgi:hypothetical protein